MQLFNYIKSLLPSIAKDTVLQDLGNTRKTLNTVAIPTYDKVTSTDMETLYRDMSRTSVVSSFLTGYKGLGSSSRISTILKTIHADLAKLEKHIVYLEHELSGFGKADLQTSGLTARTATLLSSVEHITFVTDFSVRIMGYIVDRASGSDNSPPGQTQHIKDNAYNFGLLLSLYSTINLKRSIKDVPQIVLDDVDRVTPVMEASLTRNSIMKGRVPINNFMGSPIYHVRMIATEWFVLRYKTMKTNKKLMELKLIHLQELKLNDTDNPKLTKQIKYYEETVRDLEYRLRVMEEG